MPSKKSNQSNKKLETLRHSASHVLAQAILNLYPDTKLGIGPSIEDGFYYDFEFKKPITENDLPKIEKEMAKIIKKNLPIAQVEKSRNEALKFFQDTNQPYKIDLINEIKDKKLSFYITGSNDFIDLCSGPHLESIGQIKAFKLLSLAGAYWRGDENQPMLTRIYGTAFNSKDELNEYLELRQQAMEKDHRKLNNQMELFMIDQEIGTGLILWKPRGAYLRYQIMKYAFETYLANGYAPVSTPHIANSQLWQTSGHLDYYKESMYAPLKIDNEEYLLKPMNCPGHIKIYQNRNRSYRELPIRYTEMGTVYRYEKTGELHGLMRVRGFTQDDGHVICTEEQLEQELSQALELTFKIMKTFGLTNYEVTISDRDPKEAKKKYLGDEKIWQKSIKTLVKIVEDYKIPYTIEPGEAAFYGPKIDVMFTDSLKRKVQLSTIQLDFNLPIRFNMNYTAQDGKFHKPFVIHRAILGSLERFIGILLEHYGGDLPLWLQMEKARIIPISDKQVSYAQIIQKELKAKGIQSQIDDKNEPLNGRIKQAEIEKIPYIVIIGDKEKDSNSVSVRLRKQGNIGLIALKKFAKGLEKEVKQKMITSFLAEKAK